MKVAIICFFLSALSAHAFIERAITTKQDSEEGLVSGLNILLKKHPKENHFRVTLKREWELGATGTAMIYDKATKRLILMRQTKRAGREKQDRLIYLFLDVTPEDLQKKWKHVLNNKDSVWHAKAFEFKSWPKGMLAWPLGGRSPTLMGE